MKAWQSKNYDDVICFQSVGSDGVDGQFTVEVKSFSRLSDKALTINCDEIIRRVNAHDALISALQTIERQFSLKCAATCMTTPDLDAITQGRNALALAAASKTSTQAVPAQKDGILQGGE